MHRKLGFLFLLICAVTIGAGLRSTSAWATTRYILMQCDGQRLFVLYPSTDPSEPVTLFGSDEVLEAGLQVCVLATLGENSSPTWYYVKTQDGVFGWIKSRLVGTSREFLDTRPTRVPSPTPLVPTATPVAPRPEDTICTTGWGTSTVGYRVRRGPGITFATTGHLVREGDEVCVLRVVGSWIYLRLSNGTEGYTHADGIQLAVTTGSSVPQATPEPTPSAAPVRVVSLLPPPPAALDLDPFYQKYLDGDGVPFVSSEKVPDIALYRSVAIFHDMLANRADLRARMATLGIRVAILAATEDLTDIPEYSDLYQIDPSTDWDNRGRGLGPSRVRPVASAAEENVLCYQDDTYWYEDILVHELAHAIWDFGVTRQPGGAEMVPRLRIAYEDALAAGLWRKTYAAENVQEYWAEGVQSWFGLNDPAGRLHNGVNTRAELEAYDPVLAGLIAEVFGDTTVANSCHFAYGDDITAWIQGVVIGPDGQPLEDIGLWAWQNELARSGFGWTGSDGAFAIGVPDGSFTLDIWAGEGCDWVGWYRGGSLTTQWPRADWISVDGTDREGIVIRLPARPEDLPRVEHCANT